MKLQSTILLLLLMSFTQAFAQTVTVLKPGPEEGNDSPIFSIGANNNYGYQESLTSYTWTYQGNLALKRFLIDFDLSFIPTGAIVQNVELSLFYNPTDPYESFEVHTGANDMIIQKVLSEWEENSVTWNNQPLTDEMSEMVLPSSSSSTEDYLNIDVTELFTNADNTLSENHGLLIKLVDEVNYYKSVLFASSENPDAALHPELKITWNEPKGTSINDLSNENQLEINIYPNPSNGLINFTSSRFINRSNIELLSMEGKKVPFNLTASNQIEIEQNGIFILRFSIGDQNIQKKVVVNYN